jgi:phospholipid/cholesterol/gamma-HCH transport system substrate-binding protein
MPRTRSIAWSQLKLGIVGVIAIALVIVLVVAVGGEGGFFWERYPLKARFDNVMGLKTGAVVRLSGKDIGKVTAVEFAGRQVEVTVEVTKDVRPLITTDSVASIGSVSMLGENLVDITTASTGTPLEDHAYLKASQSQGLFGDLTTTASNSLQEATRLIADVRAGRGSIGKLFTDDALYGELQQFVNAASGVARNLESGRGTLGRLARDPAVHDALKASLDNLQTMTDRINSGQGALGRFLNDEAMGRSLSGTLSSLEQATGKINKGEGTVGRLLNDRELYDRLNSMANRIDQVTAGLESGRGTAGQLLNDRQLYENMNRAVNELRDLLAEIRKDPKKYLRVSVSIF